MQRTFPRPSAHHEVIAANVLSRFGSRSGWTPAMPVPIHAIIEDYGLTILCEVIDEPTDTAILGSLEPPTGIVRLNESHLELFDDVVGPEAFTLAHELGHWLYDAVDERVQGTLFPRDAGATPVLCRTPGADHTSDVREINANGFAAALLMPEDLIRSALKAPFRSEAAFNERAANWGVSRQALRIRLERIGFGFFLPV